MRTVDQYLASEMARSMAAVALLLLVTSVGLMLGDTLSDVARGKVPAELLFSQMGLRVIEMLTVIVPLAIFLGVLLALGRLHRDSEMVVLSAVGVSRYGLYRPLALIVVPLIVILLVLGLWGSPWALRTAKQMVEDATKDASVAGLSAGRFHVVAAHNSVIYVESVGREGREFGRTFIHTERNGRKDVVAARSGEQSTDPETGAKYLALNEGTRAEGAPGQADYRLMEFARNEIRLPDLEGEPASLKQRALPLEEILRDNSPAGRAEANWRFAPALAALALAALSVPLARSRPRQGYYGSLVIGLLVYIVYANLLALGRSWLEKGALPMWLGLWWLPLVALLLAAALLHRWRR